MRRLPLLQTRREELRSEVPSDAALVKEALAGDTSALEALFRRHRNSVYRLSCRLVGWTDADDLLQDCFVDVFGSLHRLRDHDAFSGWLSAIVVRTAHKRLRRRRLLERLGLRRRWPIDVELLLAPSAPPEVLAEIRELYSTLTALPAEAQIAFLLRRVEGLSLDEIAAKMNRSLATVKRRLVQADEFLKAKLERDPEKGRA
jgi:RNA polymerase sigma-70 factor (ECF subfamily)